jgi:hypothetical protein
MQRRFSGTLHPMLQRFPLAGAKVEALTSSDALLGLITVEGLLFAALAVGVGLAGESKAGERKIVRGPKLAWAITAAILLVSFGAAMAWLELFANGGLSGFRDVSVAAALGIGIAAQPCLAAWISAGVK